MTTTFDTSGAVHGVIASDGGLCAILWRDLSPFTQGYIEALLAALDEQRMAHYQDRRRKGLPEAVPIKSAYRWLAPETLARIIADCEAFQASPAHDHGGDRRAKGAALWKARNAIPNLGSDRYRFPPLTVQLGDDGKVRFAG